MECITLALNSDVNGKGVLCGAVMQHLCNVAVDKTREVSRHLFYVESTFVAINGIIGNAYL